MSYFKNYLKRWFLPSLLITLLFLAGTVEYKKWQCQQRAGMLIEVVYFSVEKPERFEKLQEIAKRYPR